VDLGIISQFQYKHEGTTYESVSDQDEGMCSPKVNEMIVVYYETIKGELNSK
jgi:hypothetical protein